MLPEAGPASDAAQPQPVVLDTNIVLDLLLFDDAAVQPLKQGLSEGRLRWLATSAMREEFERVLGYPRIAPRLAVLALDLPGLLAAFDRLAQRVDAVPAAAATCADADDQKFVDLAVVHHATLLSKDKAVLALRRKLAPLAVMPMWS